MYIMCPTKNKDNSDSGGFSSTRFLLLAATQVNSGSNELLLLTTLLLARRQWQSGFCLSWSEIFVANSICFIIC